MTRGRRPLANKWQSLFTDQISHLSPNQQCQSSEENAKPWLQPPKIVRPTRPFLAHGRTLEGRGTAAGTWTLPRQ